MPVITSIKQQKAKNRVNIYLDDKFGFGIDLDNFVLANLRINQVLTEEEIDKLKVTADFQKNLEKVYRFAMTRPRSEKEYIDYFKRKNFDESNHESILKKLRHLDFLDDTKFAKWWVDQRIKTKPIKVIKLELSQKGIDRNTIEDVLSETEIDEEKLAKNLLEKRMYRWKGLDKKTAKQKMSQFLMSKGFDWDVIEKTITPLT